MKDYLQDLIQHTNSLGIIDIAKVAGTATETIVAAVSDDRTLIVNGKFNNIVPGFDKTFGMPNLSKLRTIINFDEYNDESTIVVKTDNRDGEDVPTSIHFETKNKDFINDYRLMAKHVVEDKVKTVTFKGATWNVTFEPSAINIARLKKQAQANSEEVNFKVGTDNGDLKIYFGDASTHSGNMVFQSNVTGTLNKGWYWPVKVFLSIMDLPGDKTVRISDSGALEVVVDSGLAIWQYLLPGQVK